MYYFYVTIFGAIGAVLRYGLGLIIGEVGFPLNTLIVNVVGCFFLAIVIRYLETLPWLSNPLVNGLGTGLIGAFTTFSTFSVETSAYILSGAYVVAGVYVILSLTAGFVSAGLGLFVGDRLIARRRLKQYGA